MIKWAYLGLALLTVALFGWVLVDLRLQLGAAAETINHNLPEILEKSRRSADALAALSDDIRQLRDLAGAPEGARDQTIVAYADAVLDLLESSDVSIGRRSKLGGSELKDVVPASEWVVGARKEALWLTFRCKSKSELLTRLTEDKFGSDWYIQASADEDPAPVPLAEWIRAHHAESRNLQ